MSAQGLLLDIMIMLGGAVAFAVPMAAAIIWLCSWRFPLLTALRPRDDFGGGRVMNMSASWPSKCRPRGRACAGGRREERNLADHRRIRDRVRAIGRNNAHGAV